MPKKKSAKTSPKSEHGELFDKHPNLKWLIPLFFVIAAVGIYIFKMSQDNMAPTYTATYDQVEVVNSTANVTGNTTNSTMGY